MDSDHEQSDEIIENSESLEIDEHHDKEQTAELSQDRLAGGEHQSVEVDENTEPVVQSEQEEPVEEPVSSSVLSDKTNTLNSSLSMETEPGPEGDVAVKLFRFPLGTIKKLVKLDEDVNMVNQDATFLISKATELFVQSLATESFGHTSKNKKKTIQRNDIDTAIETCECLAFLDGAMDD